jgi:hypothetical protein
MVWDDVTQFFEPEKGYLCKEFAFIWDALLRCVVRADVGSVSRGSMASWLERLTLRNMTSYADMRSVATTRRWSGDDRE